MSYWYHFSSSVHYFFFASAFLSDATLFHPDAMCVYMYSRYVYVRTCLMYKYVYVCMCLRFDFLRKPECVGKQMKNNKLCTHQIEIHKNKIRNSDISHAFHIDLAIKKKHKTKQKTNKPNCSSSALVDLLNIFVLLVIICRVFKIFFFWCAIAVLLTLFSLSNSIRFLWFF